MKIESSEADKRLLKLCSVQQSGYNRQFILDIATNTFDYLGSIASFLVIAIPIFAGVYDKEFTDHPAELARIISENAFVCMYLIYQFSKLVNLAPSVSTIAGVTHRVAEIFELLNQLPLKHDAKMDEHDEQ